MFVAAPPALGPTSDPVTALPAATSSATATTTPGATPPAAAAPTRATPTPGASPPTTATPAPGALSPPAAPPQLEMGCTTLQGLLRNTYYRKEYYEKESTIHVDMSSGGEGGIIQ